MANPIPFAKAGKANEAVMLCIFSFLLQEVAVPLGELSFLSAVVSAAVVRLTADAPWPIMHC